MNPWEIASWAGAAAVTLPIILFTVAVIDAIVSTMRKGKR